MLPLLLLVGCGDSAPPTAATPASPPVVAISPQQAAGSPKPQTAPPPDPAFTPLPSPNQVKQAQSLGRFNPFQPLEEEIKDLTKPTEKPAKAGPGASVAAGGLLAQGRPAASAPLLPPADFAVTGLLGRPGRAEAFVSYQGRVGSLRVGDRGAVNGQTAPNLTTLLPENWTVAAINLAKGSIRLRYGIKTVEILL